MKTKTKNSLNIISYNLKYHRAFNELNDLVDQYDADFICVQECYSDLLPKKIRNLEMADSTRDNRLGLAIYYNPKRFDVVLARSFPLKKSVYEKVILAYDDRLLITKVFDKQTKQEISLGSFHATPFGSNYIRRNQIQTAHQILSDFSNESPAIMVGDYNYPLFKRGLKVCIEESGYKLNLSDRPTYVIAKLLQGHYDFTTSINTTIELVKTLPKGISDHKPILIKAVV